MPIPIGVASPIMVDGEVHIMPMATTEGCLLASTIRGAKATYESGGITTIIYGDKMTRSPVVKFNSIKRVLECMEWIRSEFGFSLIKSHFDKTTRFGSLLTIDLFPVNSYCQCSIRFCYAERPQAPHSI